MHDIVICGAGPAGSAAARRLAAAGARVALVGAASRPGWEGLSARSRALLAEEGLEGETDVIAGPFARRGSWADGRSVEGIEWLVERSRLAEALRDRAISAGAVPRFDTVTSLKRAADHWCVNLRSGEVLEAPILIDARGRRGAQRRGPVLLAYGQRFRKRTQTSSGTQIGVMDFGWCWWAGHGTTLWIQVVGRPRCGYPAAWIAAAAEQLPALGRALDRAAIDGEPVARAAHARFGAAGKDPTLWRVGDAALAHDPLSGQGVYEALRGATLTSTAIQSVMQGGDANLAQRFIADRREESWQHGVGVAADFYRENADHGAFWAETAAAYGALLHDSARAAARGTAAGTAGGMARIERRPVLEDGRILERDVIVTAENPRGVWHVAGVPLVTLKAYLDSAERATIAGAAAALDRTPAAVASAIHWLRQKGAMQRHVPPQVSSGG
jgi:2-polyprenyl-6-methoxyphenol hydroxylase-like FAD-dependent oxidoreductase